MSRAPCGIAEADVIGVPDAKWGEAVMAIVAPKTERAIDEAELIAFACASPAAFKAPKIIDVISGLPRNASGKVLKTDLREPDWQGFDRRVTWRLPHRYPCRLSRVRVKARHCSDRVQRMPRPRERPGPQFSPSALRE